MTVALPDAFASNVARPGPDGDRRRRTPESVAETVGTPQADPGASVRLMTTNVPLGTVNRCGRAVVN